MADYENFETTFEDGVLRAEMHSTSKMNGFNAVMGDELLDIAIRLHEEPVRCFVLTGSDGVFSAGGDVGEFLTGSSPSAFRRGASILHDAMVQFHQAAVPIVTGVNGLAVGAGFSLAIFGDYVLVSEDAYFEFGYPNLGASSDGGSTFYLPRLVGLREAKRIALLNERIDPEEAVDIGLASEAVPAGEFDDRLTEVAQKVAEGPTLALGRTQRLLTESTTSTIEQQLARETETFARTARSEDFAEGVTAFVERREPEFEGR
ncbi:enoyl-CoA hydratase-related protein [Salinirubellus salinus]|uniref:Enoyl-CoA hydratase-related protein n=1 Tax=Salinirubellus salinus TaxID=1364945 RepID=A0A9E7R593_9EURY|nr:enoyl-CoA hydratase-related protein [Salinirubellus salinus]UWM56135.1 enoyl-CoA hydratase-related protein [Salinirubellus salinus]